MNGEKAMSGWLQEYLLSERSCEDLRAQRNKLLEQLESYKGELYPADITHVAEHIANAEADIDGLTVALRKRGC